LLEAARIPRRYSECPLSNYQPASNNGSQLRAFNYAYRTVFKVLSGRSASEAQEVVSESAKGVLTTDRYGAYNWLSARRRQLCRAHLMRDFQAMVERAGDSAQVGQELLDQSKEMFRLWHEVRDGTLSRREFAVELQPIQQEVKKLLEAGSRSGHKKTGRTCQRIMKVEKSLWTFVRVEGVEPTNNAAERALRRAVLSGGGKASGRRAREVQSLSNGY
jgi:transposase